VALPVATVKPVTPVVTKATVAAATAEATAEATPEATAEATAEGTVPSLKTNSTKNGNCDLLMPAHYVEYRSGKFVPIQSPDHSGISQAQPKISPGEPKLTRPFFSWNVLAGLCTQTEAATGALCSALHAQNALGYMLLTRSITWHQSKFLKAGIPKSYLGQTWFI